MVDFDDIFKLATPKMVYIRDAKLGLLKYMFMLLIFFYVVISGIMMANTHLKPQTAEGTGTIEMRHPVENCNEFDATCADNFENIARLPYCKQYLGERRLEDERESRGDADKDDKGKDAEAKGPKLGDIISEQKTCRYLDDERLTINQVPNEIFIPTRYASYKQRMKDECYDPLIKGKKGSAGGRSASYFRCKDAWDTISTDEYYVADIEQFTLSFQHSYMAPTIGLYGVSTEHQGFVATCPNNHPTNLKAECTRMKIPNTNGPVAPEDEVGLVNPLSKGLRSLTGTDVGLDEISVGDLLKLTPMAQTQNWTRHIPDRKMPKSFGHPEQSMREEGGMLILDVAYDNTGMKRPGLPGVDMPALMLGAIKPITYTYRPYIVPVASNKRVEMRMASEDAQSRTVNVWYGITVKFSFEGKLVKFSMADLLTAFTTGLVLLSSATTLVVMIALYIAPLKEKFTLCMYQLSEDFTDYNSLKSAKAAEFDKMDAHAWAGDLIVKALGRGKLDDKEVLDILTNHEMRLNRGDGVDPPLADPVNEHPVKKRVVARKHEFYKQHGVAIQDAGVLK